MRSDQLELIADELEEAAGTAVPANDTEAGRWLRIAQAAETIAGVSTPANVGVTGYMLRAAIALESLGSTTGAEENPGYYGYLKRIVEALEERAGAASEGSLALRAATAAVAVVFGPLTVIGQMLAKMQSRRVDFVGIGDSNQILSGTGWDHGFQYALTTLGYQMHATALVTQNEGGGTGGGQGYGFTRFGALMGATTGAPADLQKYLSKGTGGLSPADATYVSGSVAAGIGAGLHLQPANAQGDVLGSADAIEADVHWGSFDSGTGAFRPSIRLEVSPFTTLATAPVTSTNTGAFGMQRYTLQLAADPTRAGKNMSLKPLSGATGITGPFFMTYYRWRNPGRTAGFSYGTLEFRGGQSLRTMAYDLQQASDATLTHYFGILREDQGEGEKTICLCVNSGLNDRNETLPSVGPGAVADGDSPEAFVDNFIALRTRIEEIWALNGWPLTELYWLITPAHPVSDPDDAELVAYRAAITAHIGDDPRAQVLDLTTLITSAQMLANGWYAGGGSDRNHLTQAGYEQLSLKTFISSLTLGTLALSDADFVEGTTESGTITGATAGSTITVTGEPSGFTIDSAARTWEWDGTGSASSGNLTLTETLAGATNSPWDSVIAWTVEAAVA